MAAPTAQAAFVAGAEAVGAFTRRGPRLPRAVTLPTAKATRVRIAETDRARGHQRAPTPRSTAWKCSGLSTTTVSETSIPGVAVSTCSFALSMSFGSLQRAGQ